MNRDELDQERPVPGVPFTYADERRPKVGARLAAVRRATLAVVSIAAMDPDAPPAPAAWRGIVRAAGEVVDQLRASSIDVDDPERRS